MAATPAASVGSLAATMYRVYARHSFAEGHKSKHRENTLLTASSSRSPVRESPSISHSAYARQVSELVGWRSSTSSNRDRPPGAPAAAASVASVCHASRSCAFAASRARARSMDALLRRESGGGSAGAAAASAASSVSSAAGSASASASAGGIAAGCASSAGSPARASAGASVSAAAVSAGASVSAGAAVSVGASSSGGSAAPAASAPASAVCASCSRRTRSSLRPPSSSPRSLSSALRSTTRSFLSSLSAASGAIESRGDAATRARGELRREAGGCAIDVLISSRIAAPVGRGRETRARRLMTKTRFLRRLRRERY